MCKRCRGIGATSCHARSRCHRSFVALSTSSRISVAQTSLFRAINDKMRDEAVAARDEFDERPQTGGCARVFHSRCRNTSPYLRRRPPMNSSTTINTAASGRKILLTLLAGSLIGSICAATAGAATADSDVPSVTVRYDDLNLSSEAGTRALYNRLVVAAKQVCPDDSSRQLATLQLVKVCREQAVINAARQIPSPQLAALVARAVKSG